jgi:hypothetical protein
LGRKRSAVSAARRTRSTWCSITLGDRKQLGFHILTVLDDSSW